VINLTPRYQDIIILLLLLFSGVLRSDLRVQALYTNALLLLKPKTLDRRTRFSGNSRRRGEEDGRGWEREEDRNGWEKRGRGKVKREGREGHRHLLRQIIWTEVYRPTHDIYV